MHVLYGDGDFAWLFIIPMAMLLKKILGKWDSALRCGIKWRQNRKSHLLESSNQPIGFSLSHAFGLGISGIGFYLVIISHMYIYDFDPYCAPWDRHGYSCHESSDHPQSDSAMSIPGRLLGKNFDSAGRKAVAITCALFLAGAIIWLLYSRIYGCFIFCSWFWLSKEV
jgi:hypothetical protein